MTQPCYIREPEIYNKKKYENVQNEIAEPAPDHFSAPKFVIPCKCLSSLALSRARLNEKKKSPVDFNVTDLSCQVVYPRVRGYIYLLFYFFFRRIFFTLEYLLARLSRPSLFRPASRMSSLSFLPG